MNTMMRYRASQSGQVALIVLLVMSLTLVVALSMARRTTQDVVRTTQISESAQVYSAAQSVAEEQLTQVLSTMRSGGTVVATNPVGGSEQAEAGGEAGGGESTPLNNASVVTEILTPSEYTQPLAQGEALQITMGIGDLTLEWGTDETTSCNNASLLISEYYNDAGATKVRYNAVAPNGCTRGDDIVPGASGSVFTTSTTIADPDIMFVRIIPLYAATDLYVNGAAVGDFVRIVVTAVNERGEREETGAVEVTTNSLQAPGFLDYALYSGGSIVKN